MQNKVLLIAVFALAACRSAQFGGEGQPDGKQTAGGNATPGNEAGLGNSANSSPSNPSGSDDPNSPDDDAAIGKCLAKFGSHPFGANAPYHYRKIAASVQVFGVGNGIVDNVATNEPSLVLINAAVSVLGKSNYQLLNPNGWYCLKVDVNVLTNLTINLHCKAKLADNKVDVNVGSNTNQPAGQVGVHVGSNVQVVPAGC